MFETCPICGRYSLAREYPPKPCSICEEELLRKNAIPAHRPQQTPLTPDRHTHA